MKQFFRLLLVVCLLMGFLSAMVFRPDAAPHFVCSAEENAYAENDLQSGIRGTASVALNYEIRTARYTLGRSTGKITYPYFLGNSPAETAINDRYKTFLSIVNSGEENPAPDPRCSLQWGGSLLNFTQITVEVTYNRNGAISLKETCVVDHGGAHPYHVISGLIYENDSGRSLVYTDLLRGTPDEVDAALFAALQSKVSWANESMLDTLKTYTGYSLTETGLCFYYNVGDSVARAEVIVPYTSDDSYIILLGDNGTSDPIVENPFVDVKEQAYFYTPVLWAVQKGITNGISATEFGPNANCTRGQIVTFLWRASGSPDPTGTNNPFRDVKPSEYYYKAVLWAVEKGITTGMSATEFGPHETCTRGQVATFLWRAQGKPAPAGSSNPFRDVRSSDYYYEAILWAVENGITNGTGGGKFSPEDSCTRGQIVTFLYRALA